jgi:hypothetical protein
MQPQESESRGLTGPIDVVAELTSVGINLGIVQVGDDVLDGLDGAVPVAIVNPPDRCGGGAQRANILKLPPTKNWRAMIADGRLDCDRAEFCCFDLRREDAKEVDGGL